MNIVRRPMFDQQSSGLGVVLDVTTVKHRPLNGRDTALTTSVQLPGDDKFKDEYLTEAGLQRVNFEKNAILKGVV